MFKFFKNLFKKKELREETRTIQVACECPARNKVLAMDLSDAQINALFASYLNYCLRWEQIKAYECVIEFIDQWNHSVNMSDVPSDLVNNLMWDSLRATEAIIKFRNKFVTRHCVTGNADLAAFINKI